jgi:ATP-dependent DNA helicase RecG
MLPRMYPACTPHVAESIKDLILILSNEMSREELQEKLNLKDREYFRKAYLNVAITEGLIEMTIPDKPKSIHQKYRLTEKGKKVKEQWVK